LWEPSLVGKAVELAHALAVVAETEPDHPLVTIIGDAIDVIRGRREYKRELRKASLDVGELYRTMRAKALAGGTEVVQPGVGRERRGLPGEWSVPHETIMRRRYGPYGSVEEGVEFGPAGRPAEVTP
jgi:hypothetical protein